MAVLPSSRLAHVGNLEAVAFEKQVGGLEVAVRDGPRRQLVQVGQPRAELFARRAPRLGCARALEASNPSIQPCPRDGQQVGAGRGCLKTNGTRSKYTSLELTLGCSRKPEQEVLTLFWARESTLGEHLLQPFEPRKAPPAPPQRLHN